MAASSIGARHRPIILVVGAASRDLDPSDARRWRLGGGVTYGSMAIARLGLPVRALMGLDTEAVHAPELALLEQAGVEVRRIRLASGPVFDNRPLPGGRIQIVHQASDHIAPTALPAEWRAPDAVVLAPVAAELGPAWARSFPAPTIVALGWQGLLRRLVAGRAVEPLPIRPLALVSRADVAVVSAEDARAGGAPLLDLLPRPGQQLVITNGPRPAIHVLRTRSGLAYRIVPVEPAANVRDETGAGDVFLATWAAGLAALAAAGAQELDARCLAVAAAAASTSVEADHLDELADVDALCRRLLRSHAEHVAPP